MEEIVKMATRAGFLEVWWDRYRKRVRIGRMDTPRQVYEDMEAEQCRLYEHGEKVRVYLPLLDWTNDDVERFIRERGIKCAPVYYDSEGCFHVERRLGCLCCPLMSINKRKEEFRKYPNMLKFYLRGGAEIHGERSRGKGTGTLGWGCV